MPRFSRLFLFPDVNVWVALTYNGHEQHEIARLWFESLASEERVCFCRFTQLSLLRLLTTSAVMGGDEVMSQAQAWEAYDRWHVDERVLYIDEPPNLEAIFRSLTRQSSPNPKNWSDSYLAAFALASDLRLVTFDRAFRGKLENLLILET